MKKKDNHLSFTIYEDTYHKFIEIFNDKNPMHTDDAFAKERGFKEKVMHGNILNGYLSYFIGECLETQDIVIISQDINYHNPFYIGDVLDFEYKISEENEALQIRTYKYKFRNQEKTLIARGKIQIKIFS